MTTPKTTAPATCNYYIEAYPPEVQSGVKLFFPDSQSLIDQAIILNRLVIEYCILHAEEVE